MESNSADEASRATSAVVEVVDEPHPATSMATNTPIPQGRMLVDAFGGEVALRVECSHAA